MFIIQRHGTAVAYAFSEIYIDSVAMIHLGWSYSLPDTPLALIPPSPSPHSPPFVVPFLFKVYGNARRQHGAHLPHHLRKLLGKVFGGL